MRQLLDKGFQLKGWILGKKLGSGACSDVYEAFPTGKADKKDSAAFVIKVSPLPTALNNKNKKRKKSDIERNADSLYAEHLLYRSYLHDHAMLPKLPTVAYGEDQGYRFLVMERLGRNLDDVLRVNGSIPPKTAARLALDMMGFLEYLHSKNILYVDVKPANFMLDNGKENKLYCVDFGISDRFVTAAGKHKVFKSGTVIGTPTFLSLHCHGGATPSRRDDIEALLYVMVYLMRGHLPWQSANSDAQGAKIKKETSVVDLCSSLPDEWIALIERARKCAFEEKPEYEYYKKKLSALAGKYNAKDPFVWGKENAMQLQPNEDTKSPPRKHPVASRKTKQGDSAKLLVTKEKKSSKPKSRVVQRKKNAKVAATDTISSRRYALRSNVPNDKVS